MTETPRPTAWHCKFGQWTEGDDPIIRDEEILVVLEEMGSYETDRYGMVERIARRAAWGARQREGHR